MDDVVDLSMAPTAAPGDGISQETVRDLQALTQASGLTITRAPAPPVNSSNATNATTTPAVNAEITDNGSAGAQDNGETRI